MRSEGDGSTVRAVAHRRVTGGRGSVYTDVSEAWHFRGLWWNLVRRDLTLRYRQTALGVIWVALQPLLAAGAFALVFGHVAKLPSEGVPYLPFALAGLLGWTAFSGFVLKATTSLVNNSAMVSKVYFPRVLLPLSALGATVIDLLVGVALFFVVMALTGAELTASAPLAVLYLIPLLVTAVGAGLMLSALVTRFRDVNYVVTAGLQVLLYASPVAYSVSAVPRSDRVYYSINPLSGLLEGLRSALVGAPSPDAGSVGFGCGFALLALVLGLLVFARMDRSFADVI